MFGGAPGDVDVGVAVQWLWRTYTPQRVAGHPFLPSPLTFVDVETTRDRVVELAMVRFVRGMAPAVFHTWVDPGAAGWARSADYWNTDIHGLTPRLVWGRPAFGQVAPMLVRYCDDATVAAHNVAFERRFLGEELHRLGGRFNRPVLCTLQLARRLYPDRRAEGSSYRLDDLASLLDVRNPAPHRAIGDTFTTLWVLLAMLERHQHDPDVGSHVRAAMRTGSGGRSSPWTG